ncbi:hypothetical protein BC829DRAFT_264239 [Chytridium lagenaria]|nr:hypothetical protein BC829DRAFT_264239 [Chytridium lagenaria]
MERSFMTPLSLTSSSSTSSISSSPPPSSLSALHLLALEKRMRSTTAIAATVKRRMRSTTTIAATVSLLLFLSRLPTCVNAQEITTTTSSSSPSSPSSSSSSSSNLPLLKPHLLLPPSRSRPLDHYRSHRIPHPFLSHHLSRLLLIPSFNQKTSVSCR